MKLLGVAGILFFASLTCLGQQVPSRRGPAIRELNERLMEAAESRRDPATARQDYRIGPEDLLEVTVFEVPELSRTVRVSAAGQISLPLIGTVKVGGLSPMELEDVLKEMLRKTYVRDPQVSVFLREYKSDPVSVIGAVKMPGPYHIQTRKSLIEVLAMAQGLSDGPFKNPGRTVVISRKPRPRAAASSTRNEASNESTGSAASADDGQPEGEIVEVPLKELLQSGDPKWNVPIYPGDVVKVPPAGTVYVAGDVYKPGGFPLTDFDYISVIQAVAMAGGTLRTANRKESLIIRLDATGNRQEQKINLGRIMSGKDPDPKLQPNDILIVPGSVGRAAALRAIETAIQTTSGVLIWRR